MICLMTYNIRLGIQQGVEAVAARINAAKPDIVALQEVGHHWIMGPSGDTTAKLAKLTGLDHHIFVPAIFEDNNAQYGHAILSRYPITALQHQNLTQNEDEPRVLLHSRLHISETFNPIFLTTHLSWLDSDRPTHAKELTEAVNHYMTQGESVFVMGDLNEHHDVAWIQSLTHILADADHQQSRLTYPSTEPRLRLDYLLCSEGHWQDPTIIEDVETSDHFPVIATWRP